MSRLLLIWDAATKNIFKTITLFASISAASVAMVEGYTVYENAKNIPETVGKAEVRIKNIEKKLDIEIQRVNIAFNTLRAELDHDSIYENVEESNGGDKWFFTNRKVHDTNFIMIFSASYNKKKGKYGYIDLNNNHYWILNNHNHQHEEVR